MSRVILSGWLAAAAVLAGCGGGGSTATETITGASPPPGLTGAAYSGYTFTTSGGGAPPFRWSESGSMPPGLTLSSSGQLSGTPAMAGTYPIVVTVADSSASPLTAVAAVSLLINDSPIVVTPTPAPPAGTVTIPYPGFSFTAGGGSPPYTWHATGLLPPGLIMGANGSLSGTPTQAGSFSFSVTATDSAQTPMNGPPLMTQVIINGQVSVTPAATNVAAGGSQQFNASVVGCSSSSVTWAVDGIVGGSAAVGTISAAGLYTAPNVAVTAVVSAVAQGGKSCSGTANVSVLAPHRFGVRTTSTLAEFYDRTSGMRFVPRGNNYIRLATLIKFTGESILAHSTFSVGLYDAPRAEAALSSMQASGYNLVTVTLQGCCQGTIGDPAGGLSNAYMLNVVDFLQRARIHGIAVVFASSWVPDFGGYTAMLGQCYPTFEDINRRNLCVYGVAATKTFYHDFVRALINAGAAMDAIFAYEVWDEYFYTADTAPLNASTGTVTTANGQTYDMSVPASRQQMMDDGLVYFANQVRGAIVSLDPTALVTISFFPPEGPNPSRIGDPRIISVYPAIANSDLDYVDLHSSPVTLNLTMDQVAQNFGFVGHQQQKPILMGESSAYKWAYPLLSDAAAGLQSWQIQSCAYGFKGWLLWTWDTDEQPEIWNALSQGGAINHALSPVSRPDPCS